ncbi:MAG: hypothetical protein Q8P18_16955 [Pseudomonadota bacterium]|nr:hypothetical protein [Pseudomonadota bacterium]
MSRSQGRWGYMSAPGYNPPNDRCPVCVVPSRTYHIGSKTVAGVAHHRYRCEHGHEWIVDEPRGTPESPS